MRARVREWARDLGERIGDTVFALGVMIVIASAEDPDDVIAWLAGEDTKEAP